jgi:NAD(P)-dependent dehydrogenase (short-subunit alcohol dehydrogenase family)
MPTVLVTSASRGIGFEFARQYAAEGWQVLAACREPATATELAAIGAGVEVVAMDVTDLASVRAAAGASDAPVDLLVNSAGIMGQLDDLPGNVDYAEWARVLDVNAMGPVRVLDAFVPRLAAAGGAKALTITSGMGSLSDIRSGTAMMYRTSKAAVNMAMRARALQLRDRGITVAVINPGWVRTDMGGPGASISVEQSIAAMRKVIDALTPDQAGSFLNWKGGTYPW